MPAALEWLHVARTSVMDTGKAKSELGWSPKYTSAETLAALAAAYSFAALPRRILYTRNHFSRKPGQRHIEIARQLSQHLEHLAAYLGTTLGTTRYARWRTICACVNVSPRQSCRLTWPIGENALPPFGAASLCQVVAVPARRGRPRRCCGARAGGTVDTHRPSHLTAPKSPSR